MFEKVMPFVSISMTLSQQWARTLKKKTAISIDLALVDSQKVARYCKPHTMNRVWKKQMEKESQQLGSEGRPWSTLFNIAPRN